MSESIVAALLMVQCLFIGMWIGGNRKSSILVQLRNAARQCKVREKFHGGGMFASTFEVEMIVDGEPYLIAMMPKREGVSFAPMMKARP